MVIFVNLRHVSNTSLSNVSYPTFLLTAVFDVGLWISILRLLAAAICICGCEQVDVD
jgi:hypothetical protein